MGSEVEIVEHVPPVTLFGSDDPAAVIAKASAVATALKGVIQKQKLVANISGKHHVLVDGWTLCGTMLGVFPIVVRTTEIWRNEELWGFEAYTEARTIGGAVVGAAAARCTKTEKRWRAADDYAILSMAQTRSVSKALRVPLGFIISMAGYEATPAEEVQFLEETSEFKCEVKSPEGWPCVRPTYHTKESKAHFFKKPDGYDAESVPAGHDLPSSKPPEPEPGSSASGPGSTLSETLPLDV